jgi:drug/metabolite transporter (DMT)-like permease
MRRPSRRALTSVQAAYYTATALAPFVSRRAFEAVTGPKHDWWLVLTVSALVGGVGATLAVSARGQPPGEVVVLGAATATALGTIDVVYAARGRIPRVYLVDAAVQLPLAAAWVLTASPTAAGE